MKKVLWIIALFSFSGTNCTNTDSEFNFTSFCKNDLPEQQFQDLKCLITNHEIGNTQEFARIREQILTNWNFLVEKKEYFMTSSFTFQNWWKKLTPVTSPKYSCWNIFI